MARFGEEQGGFGSKIRRSREESERLNRAALSRFDEKLGRLDDEEQDVMSGLRAGVGRASSQAFGRRAGRARSGGMLRGQSQIEMDLRRQAGEARRTFSSEREQTQMDRIALEKSMMKSPEQLQMEAKDHTDEIERLYDNNAFAGVLNDRGFARDINDYVNRMGLDGEAAREVRRLANQKQQGAFFNVAFG